MVLLGQRVWISRHVEVAGGAYPVTQHNNLLQECGSIHRSGSSIDGPLSHGTLYVDCRNEKLAANRGIRDVMGQPPGKLDGIHCQKSQ